MHRQRHTSNKKIWALGLAALLGVAALALWLLRPPQPPPAQPPAQPVSSTALLDAQSCQECHAQQFSEWLGSHHEQAMQPANAETVLGNFQNATFSDGAATSRFFQQDGQFVVNTIGEDGKYADFTVRYT
ncbi:MAG: multiheme c-type cytochrome, partial [Caldilinea sp.]